MEDEKIIDLFFARKEEALLRTDETYGRGLHRISDNILHCREDAEECVSDTYMRAWNAIPPARPRSLFGYLARICRNLSLTRLDWANAAKRRAEVVSLTQEMEQCIPANCQEEIINARELGRQLNAFLNTLSRENQMIFVRRYWFVDTTGEIAARYGISEAAVLKDGTAIDLAGDWKPLNGADQTGLIPLDQVEYILLIDGTKLYPRSPSADIQTTP